MLQYQGYGGVGGILAGSKHLFTLNGIERVLHDCGSDMEDTHSQSRLPFQSRELTAVVFSHGHYDHMGELPKLHMEGYNGRFFGTEATKELAQMSLTQTVNDEFRRASEYNQSVRGRRDTQGKLIPFRRPSFVGSDVREMMSKFQGLKYGLTVNVADHVRATLYDAGHIIGSAQVLYEFDDRGRTVRVLTCVDLGRSDIDCPIVKFPHTQFPGGIDYCFIESTYGGRKHTDKEQSRMELEEVLLEGIRSSRRMLCGAFSIMRTHSILSDLYWVYKRGNLPSDFKIYLDSPGSLKVNKIIMNHPEDMDDQARADFRERKEHPFAFPNLVIVRDKKLSLKLDEMPGPYLIISASGMWFMGRVVRHLKSHIEDENALLVQTGYQVPGKTGGLLEEGKEKHPVIEVEGEKFDYRARQIRLRSYGSHADGDDCIRHVMEHVHPQKKVFIVHGEMEQGEWMKANFEQKGMPSEIVMFDQVYDL
jgi:metallo-beta-lactamase family protein